MSNQIAFKTHTRPGDEIIIEANSHPVHYEAGGMAFHSGIMPRLVNGVRGIFTKEQVTAALRPNEPHYSRVTCLSIENTHNTGGGTVWPLPALQEVCATAKQHNLTLHLDGSRLLNASVASGVPANIICAPFDSIALCFSKGLGAPVGSCLAGSKAFIEEARHYKQLFGGAMRQAGIIAAGALYALRHNVSRLYDDHANSRRLATGLAEIPGISLDPDHIETNIVFFDVVDPRFSAAQVSDCLAAEGVLIEPADGPNRMRAVTHMDVEADDIEKAIVATRKVFCLE